MLTITPLAAGILGILFIILTARVGLYRVFNKVALGDGDDNALFRRIRAQGNFVETAPFALFLLYLCEVTNAANENSLIAIAAALVFGRAMHAFSLSYYETKTGKLYLRVLGMVGTMGGITASVIILLSHHVGAL